MDLVIRQAALPEKEGQWDVAIEQGRIAAITSQFNGRGKEEINADGDLLSPAFVDAHMHLDKSLVGEQLPYFPTDSLLERIELARKIQWEMAKQTAVERATNLAKLALAKGTTILRSHVDIDPVVGLKNLETVLAVKEQFADRLTIQIVAFPQSGILRAPGTVALLKDALRQGAEVIGGIDPGSLDGDIQRHIDQVFDIAQEFDVDVDFHLHDPGHLGTFTLRCIAEKTVATSYQGRVLVGHVFCLGEVNEREVGLTIDTLKDAEISIVSAPQSSKSLPPVDKLLEAGVNVLCASDNVQDAWSPFGNADMLERALLVAHKFNLRTDEQLHQAYRMITCYPAQALRMNGDYGLAEGLRADLVLLGACSVPKAIITQAQRRCVIRNGRVLHDIHESNPNDA